MRAGGRCTYSDDRQPVWRPAVRLACTVCAACLVCLAGAANASANLNEVIQTAPPSSPRLNTTQRVLTITAPLKDREVYLGDVELQIAPDDSVEVSALQVVTLLARSLNESALENLRAIAEPGVFVPLSRFDAAGAPLIFDPRTLELTIQIAPTARTRQSIGLAELDRNIYGDFAQPEPFSAYLNVRGSLDYVHEGGATGFGDPLFLMDAAINLQGWVLENDMTWRPGSGGDEFSRDGTRLVVDDLERLNRWVMGDLRPQSRGFQGVSDMAGVSVSRTYALLEPQRNVTPRGGRTFTIQRDSTVEAFINGRSVRTIRLNPGVYDVSDFPFVQGSNDVRLVITDDTGLQEVMSFSLFIDRTQLAAGLSEYGMHAGVFTSRMGGEIDYSDDYVVSGFYRRGLTDSLTLGGNAQAAESGYLLGVEGVWGNELGTFGGDFAVSDLDSAGSGWAVNASYERLIQDMGGGGLSILATFEARSRRFGSIGAVMPDNPYSYIAGLNLSRSFGDSQFAGVQLRYARARSGYEDESTVRMTYGRRLTSLTNLIFDVDWSEGGFAEGVNFRVALVRRFGDTGSVRAEYDSRGDRARVGYQTSGGQGVGAWSATANVDANPDNYGLNGAVSYAANRAELGLAHSTAYSDTLNTISDQRTSLRVGTALAFAGGRLALGRPVSDGFVIIRPYEGLDAAIEVDPNQRGYYARSGALGPALYGQVSAYSPRTVTVDAPEAPAGFDLGQGAVRIHPGYRAGYVATVGSAYSTTVIGHLVDHQGEPVTLLAGRAVEIGGEGRTVEVFTNRQGRFGASGVKPGRWRIELPGSPPLVYEMIVPETEESVVRLEVLTPMGSGQ